MINIHDAKTEKDKRRVKNLNEFKKYEVENDPHSIRTEYEADAYARIHKNGDQQKRALRETYKHIHKTKYQHNSKKDYDDMKRRSKALNDKSIDLSVYQ